MEPPLPRSSSLKHRSSGTKPPIFPLVGIFTKDNKSQFKPPTSPTAVQSTSALSKLKPVPGERDPQRTVRIISSKTVRFSPDRDTGKVSICKTVKPLNLSKLSNNSGDTVNDITPSSPVKYISLSPVSPSGKSSVKTPSSPTRGGVTILRNEKRKSPSTSDYDTVANCCSSSESLNEDKSQYSGYDNIDIRNSLNSQKEESNFTVNIYDNVADLKTSVSANKGGEGDYDTVADYEEILTLSPSINVTSNIVPPPVPGKHPRTSLSPQSSQEDLTSPWKVNLKERIKPNLQNFKGEKVFKKDTVVTNIYVPGFEPGNGSGCVKNKQVDEGSLPAVHTVEALTGESQQDLESKPQKSSELGTTSAVKKQTSKGPQSALSKSTNSSVVEKSKRGTTPKSVKWSDDCVDDAAPSVSKHQLKNSFLNVGVLRKKFTKGNLETQVVECSDNRQSETERDSEVFVEKETPRKMSHLRIGVKVLPGGSMGSIMSPAKSPDPCYGGMELSPHDKPKEKVSVRFCDDCNGSNSEVDIYQQLNGSYEQSEGRSDRDSVDMTGSQQDLQQLHLRMIEERKKEQQVAAQEKQRLEDILLMCAEYEKQLESELSPPPLPAKESPGEKRSSMTKIKTNGSLTKLTSPTLLQKDAFAFDFKWPRNSASSNSEEEDSEKDGTIKRRPGVTNGRADTNGIATSVSVATVTVHAPCEHESVDSASNGKTSRPQLKCNGIETFQPAASPPAIPEPLSIKMPSLIGTNLCDVMTSSPSSYTGAKSPLSDAGRSCYGSDSSEYSSTRLACTKDRVTSSSGVETSSEQSLNGFEVRCF